MIKIITFLTILLFSFGCSFKTSFTKPDMVLQKSLSWTKKGEIYNSLEVKVAVFATYVNPLVKTKGDDEEFVVSIFIDDDYKEKSKYGLNNPDISLTLDGVKPLSKKELDDDSRYKRLVPFDNAWAHYYLVKFPKSDKKKMKLIVESQNYGATVLTFQKP